MEPREPQSLDGKPTVQEEPAEPKRRAAHTKAKKRRFGRQIIDIDPTSTVAVYSNMLIVEDALRTQYIELTRTRRKYACFFYSVVFVALYMTWTIYVASSVYQWFRLFQRLFTLSAYIVLALFVMTGLYSKIFIVGPRFLSDANKGIRSMNVRIVKQHPTMKERIFRIINPVYCEHPGRLLKIVPSPRSFSPHFIEGWEVYREEFWEKQDRHEHKKKKKKGTRDKASDSIES